MVEGLPTHTHKQGHGFKQGSRCSRAHRHPHLREFIDIQYTNICSNTQTHTHTILWLRLRTGTSTWSPAMTSAESSNEQKDNIGISWNHISQVQVPAACGRGYSPLRITKEDPSVICPTMPLYHTNAMHFIHSLTITTSYWVWGLAPTQKTGWSCSLRPTWVKSNQVNILKAQWYSGCLLRA